MVSTLFVFVPTYVRPGESKSLQRTDLSTVFNIIQQSLLEC